MSLVQHEGGWFVGARPAKTRGAPLLTNDVEVLITVKAYPQPSKTHGESVCIAGVRLDTPSAQWCRLYPVDFRGLPEAQQFHKYDIIRCAAGRPRHDSRPESLCPVLDTIEIAGSHPSWRDRWPLIEPLVASSMCEIYELERAQGTSLGLFKPGEILDFHIEGTDDEWDEGRHAVLNQQSLLPELAKRRPLEKMPYTFSFSHRCLSPTCKGHKQQIIDWEVCENYRKTRGYSEEQRRGLVRERWLERVCGSTRDTYFYAGSISRHRHTFVLLGAFWPPQNVVRPEVLALF